MAEAVQTNNESSAAGAGMVEIIVLGLLCPSTCGNADAEMSQRTGLAQQREDERSRQRQCAPHESA
jgi:hypothetical protein